MRKEIVLLSVLATCVLIASLSSADTILNGGFENGSVGWTSENEDEVGDTGEFMHVSGITKKYHHSGSRAFWSSSYLEGSSNPSGMEFCSTYLLSTECNLVGASSVGLHIADFNSNPVSGEGYEQEIDLLIGDSSVVLVDNSYDTLSLFDKGEYTTSLGTDGRMWSIFNVPITPDYFEGLSGIDLSSAKLKICWKTTDSTNASPQLLSSGAIDDVFVVPEPSIFLLAASALIALAAVRKKSC